MSRSYKLTENSIRSINRTIRTVNQMRTTGPNGDLPFRQNQRRQRQPAGDSLLLGKTQSEWKKNTSVKIKRWYYNAETDSMVESDSEEFVAYNLFATIEQGKFVGCISGMLIAAEC